MKLEEYKKELRKENNLLRKDSKTLDNAVKDEEITVEEYQELEDYYDSYFNKKS